MSETLSLKLGDLSQRKKRRQMDLHNSDGISKNGSRLLQFETLGRPKGKPSVAERA
jgi:hypothetical protein